MQLELALKLAAPVHLGLLGAAVLMPRATNLWSEAALMSDFARTLFRIYYAFITLCLLSFGVGTWCYANELASGAPLARGVCGFLAAFWVVRGVAAILLDVRPYLTNRWWRVGYATTNIVFSILPFLYGWAALRT